MKVSVIVPVYECAAYLADALDSVFAQTYPDLEVIVVDHSPKAHGAVLQPYTPRIRYVVQESAGVSAARNLGIEQAQGDLIAFLDGDDLWVPDKLAVQMEILLQRPDVGLVFSRIEEINEAGHLKPPPAPITEPSPFGDWLGRSATHDPQVFIGAMHETLLHNNYIPTSSVIVRRACLLRAGLFDERYRICEDYDLWLRMAREYPMAFVNRVTAQYRVRADGLSGSGQARIYRWKEWNSLVLEAHLPTVPRDLRPRVREKIARRFREAGWYYLRQGRIRQAQELFTKSLRHRWYQPTALAYLVATAVAPKVFRRCATGEPA